MKRSHHFLLAVLLLTACPVRTFAHAVGVSCTLRGDKVEVEAYYADGDPAMKAKVQVLNAQEYIVASGITDDKGRCAFATPAPGTYTVRLDAGAGHRAKTMLTVPGLVTDPALPETPTTDANNERAKFTQFPWLNVLIGLALIGGSCGAFWIVSFLRNKQPSH